MAKGGNNKVLFEPGAPKKTRQGRSPRTLLSPTSRNGRKKKYRGQGNQDVTPAFLLSLYVISKSQSTNFYMLYS
jgi:hypothetical protein